MLPAVKDLDVPVVLVNIQKLKALDYDHTDIASWLGEGYACGAVGEMVADIEMIRQRHAVITALLKAATLVYRLKSTIGAVQLRLEEDSEIQISLKSADLIRV